MAREKLQTLSEPMYYILLALLEEWCGVDIMEEVSAISNNRVKVGSGTAYALLDKFQREGVIKETVLPFCLFFLMSLLFSGLFREYIYADF